MRLILVVLFATFPALAQDPGAISVKERREMAFEPVSGSKRHELRLTLAYLEGSGWTAETIALAAKDGSRILGQCGVELGTIEIVRVAAPDRFHYFLTPLSRELAAALQLRKPTVYFLTGTRQRPAFDAEAIGRGNSRTRPELRDTVWITRGTRDLDIAMTHEIVHVLMDSGEHSAEPENLMREETAPQNRRLTVAQCTRLRETASANGLLTPR